MPHYRITYATNRPPEVVEADRVSLQPGNAQVLLHKTVLVVGLPREVVVRRLSGGDVTAVEEIPPGGS